MTDTRIDLDTNELLGLSQVMRVSSEPVEASRSARILTKAGGDGGEVPPPAGQPGARLLSKVGPGGEVPPGDGQTELPPPQPTGS